MSIKVHIINNRKRIEIATITSPIVNCHELDKRSMPGFATSMCYEYFFQCKRIFRLMLKGTFKVRMTTRNPASWCKKIFKLKTPADIKGKSYSGIDMVKVNKYVAVMKANKGLNIPPVIFAMDYKNKKDYFIDGNHRLLSAYLAGVEKVPCYELDFGQVKRAYYVTPKGVKKKLAEKMDFE